MIILENTIIIIIIREIINVDRNKKKWIKRLNYENKNKRDFKQKYIYLIKTIKSSSEAYF